MLSTVNGDHSRSACKVCVLRVSPAPYTLRRKLHCSYNFGKGDLNWECWGNLCNLDQVFMCGDQQQLSAPMGYRGGPTSTLDLARPLESKPSILLPDNLQLNMPKGGPRDCQGCTALDAMCLLFVSSCPGPSSLVLLFAQCWGSSAPEVPGQGPLDLCIGTSVAKAQLAVDCSATRVGA